MGTIIMVEAKPICVKILVKNTTGVATRVTPTESWASSLISPQVLPYNSLPYGQLCHNDNK